MDYAWWTLTDEIDKTDHTHPYVLCRCVCGTERWIRLDTIRSGGAAKSCGCKRPPRQPRKPDRRPALQRIWRKMRARCYSPSSGSYVRYGGRGIKVCKEWRTSFKAFEAWALANGYREGLSIERIDNNGNYAPENCTWVEPTRQQRNRRDTVWITAWGERKSLPDWAEDPRCVVSYHTLHARIYRNNWPPEKAISQKRR